MTFITISTASWRASCNPSLRTDFFYHLKKYPRLRISESISCFLALTTLAKLIKPTSDQRFNSLGVKIQSNRGLPKISDPLSRNSSIFRPSLILDRVLTNSASAIRNMLVMSRPSFFAILNAASSTCLSWARMLTGIVHRGCGAILEPSTVPN